MVLCLRLQAIERLLVCYVLLPVDGVLVLGIDVRQGQRMVVI